MQELIRIHEHKELENTVAGKDLHSFLEIKKDFSSWVKDQVKRAMFEKGSDYAIVPDNVKTGVGVRRVDEYYFTISAAKELSMMSMTEKGQEARKYFIQCEKIAKEKTSVALPTSYLDALKALVASEEEKLKLESKVKQDAPKVDFYDEIVDSSDLISMGNVAKTLNFKGYGRNNLMKFLRGAGVLMKSNTPYQKHIDAGHFEIKERKFIVNNETKVSFTTYATTKGMDYIRKLLGR